MTERIIAALNTPDGDEFKDLSGKVMMSVHPVDWQNVAAGVRKDIAAEKQLDEQAFEKTYAPATLERAREIMGRNFIGPDHVEQALGDAVKFSAEDRAALAKVPFSEAILSAHNKDAVLIAGYPTTFRELNKQYGHMFDLDFIDPESGNDDVLDKKVQLQWYLMGIGTPKKTSGEYVHRNDIDNTGLISVEDRSMPIDQLPVEKREGFRQTAYMLPDASEVAYAEVVSRKLTGIGILPDGEYLCRDLNKHGIEYIVYRAEDGTMGLMPEVSFGQAPDTPPLWKGGQASIEKDHLLHIVTPGDVERHTPKAEVVQPTEPSVPEQTVKVQKGLRGLFAKILGRS